MGKDQSPGHHGVGVDESFEERGHSQDPQELGGQIRPLEINNELCQICRRKGKSGSKCLGKSRSWVSGQRGLYLDG